MIKTVTSMAFSHLKSICAEIHFAPPKFSILCIFCGTYKTLSYTDFTQHFESTHLQDLIKNIDSSDALKSAPQFEKHIFNSLQYSNDDPLEVHEEKLMNVIYDNQHLETLRNAENIKIFRKSLENSEEITIDTLETTIGNRDYLLEIATPNPMLNNKCNVPCDNYKQNEVFISNHNNWKRKEDEHCSSSISGTFENVSWTQPYEPNLLKNQKKRTYKPRNKPNICSYCGRIFQRRYQLDTHVNIHTGLKPHQCEVCGKQFRAVTTLTRHLNTHDQREMFKCLYCNKEFTHKAAMVSHELRHTQERKIPCNECEKFFYTANQMDTHKRKIHHKANDDDLKFSCDLCFKRYRSASMLSTHKLKKHYRTAKYSCEQCGKKCIDMEKLESHSLIHVDGLAKQNVI